MNIQIGVASAIAVDRIGAEECSRIGSDERIALMHGIRLRRKKVYGCAYVSVIEFSGHLHKVKVKVIVNGDVDIEWIAISGVDEHESHVVLDIEILRSCYGGRVAGAVGQGRQRACIKGIIGRF